MSCRRMKGEKVNSFAGTNCGHRTVGTLSQSLGLGPTSTGGRRSPENREGLRLAEKFVSPFRPSLLFPPFAFLANLAFRAPVNCFTHFALAYRQWCLKMTLKHSEKCTCALTHPIKERMGSLIDLRLGRLFVLSRVSRS